MTTTTPDMGLVLPAVLSTVGPSYATLINAAFTVLDSHNHSSGSGAQINPTGMSISSDLSFIQNNATNLRSARFFNNTSFTAGVNDLTCLYALSNDIYYIDGNGNNIQITKGGTLNITGTTSLTLKDTAFILEYSADTTRQFRFSAASLPTNTSVIYTVPWNGSGNTTLVCIDATQTLTNKTLGSTNTITGAVAASLSPDGIHTQTFQNSTDTVVGRATTDTLTNKTLTSPVIASLSPDGIHTQTFQNSTDTVVGRATTDTLTNKTLGSTNTITGAVAASLSPDGIHTQTFQNSTDTVVGRATTDTLTNKTLTTPVIAALNTGSYAITLPTVDGSNAQVLQTNGSGVWSFVSSATTIATIQSSTGTGQTYTNASARQQTLNPSSSRTDTLPTTSISAGDTWTFFNESSSWSNCVTLQSSGSNTVCIVPPLGRVVIQALVATPTTAANWIILERSSRWCSYAPSVTGFTSPTGIAGIARVIGDNMEMKGSFGSGTVTGSGNANITIPPAYSINSANIPNASVVSGSSIIVGRYDSNNAGSRGSLLTFPTTSTALIYFGAVNSNNNGLSNQASSAIIPNSTEMSYEVSIPISF